LVTESKTIELPRALTVKELGELLKVSAVDVIKELMKNGLMANLNQVIDYDTAAIVATDFGFEPREASTQVAEEPAAERAPAPRQPVEEEDPSKLKPRPPVVTILGHVDHGKTSLLDSIRKTNVTAQEAGGITQHIGAYQVEVDGQKITFLDTPGHEAFTAMRARGAQVTDIAVLVVAADDGVMPQTIEAINHAKAAGVPLVVAINKIDLAGADPDRVMQQLAQHDVVVEQYGGDVVAVPVSARTQQGIKDLLENIILVAEIQDLKANPDRPAAGAVIEAELTSNRGPVATLLVQRGTLRVGAVVAGETTGKVKAMFDDKGRNVTAAGPSTPVTVLGLREVPMAGDTFRVVPDERAAREEIEQRKRERESALLRETRPVNLDTLFGEISAGQVRELNLILKTDVQGSIEPIRLSLERLSTPDVHVKVIHSGSGSVTESDVMLAVASKGIIISFNARVDAGARKQAEAAGVEIRQYKVIYNLVEDVQKALTGMLEPVYKDVVDGHAEVRQVFRISRRGNVAGCMVLDGTLHRNDLVRVLRQGQQVADTKCESLRRFTEDVREVATGYECGVSLEGFDDFKEGDQLEFYHRERE
jgi:translation initiation factor IF-2